MSQVEINIVQHSSAADDVRRCLEILYGTPAGTLALDRDFGLSWDPLDLPLPAAQAAIAAEIIEKTTKYEPRARVAEITWGANTADGTLNPKVRCEIVTD